MLPPDRTAPSTAESLVSATDEVLLAMFRAGREDAFGVIHERYQGALVAVARGIIDGSHRDPADLAERAFARARDALRAPEDTLGAGAPVSCRLYRVLCEVAEASAGAVTPALRRGPP